MFKEIEFIAQSEKIWNVYEKPKPASQFIPKWWKDLPDTAESDFDILNRGTNLTVKKCIPTLDMLTAGYIVSLPCDVQVNFNDAMQSDVGLTLPKCQPKVLPHISISFFGWGGT